MNDKMTLDGAVAHAIQVVDSYADTVPDCDCAKEHQQLAKWLKELAELRQTVKQLEADKDGLTQEVQRLTIRIVESVDEELKVSKE